MNFDRRTILKGALAGSMSSSIPWSCLAASSSSKGPKRVIFFLQNHGFHPAHAHPAQIGLDNGNSELSIQKVQQKLDRVVDEELRDYELPKWIDPLEEIKDQVTILQGLNGKHVTPYHGAPYGTLGGYKKSSSLPEGETIDCALAKALPAVVPMLAFGWESLERMKASPIFYSSSAWGPSMPAPMFCDPNLAFDNLFGVASEGLAKDEFLAQTELFEFLRPDAEKVQKQLTPKENEKFLPYVEGLETISEQRRKLLAMSQILKKHSPQVTEKFSKPRFELDWWDASLEVGLSAMIAGVTNVLTIASGRCTASGSWIGLGLKHVGHSIGHTNQEEEDDWLKLRRHNMQQLLHMVQSLKSVPEGDGTMMDNTLIVYTSCHAESQHSTGDRWPYILIGNFGGTLRTGRYIHYPLSPHKASRTINSLYCSLLHAAGDRRDNFNLDGPRAGMDLDGPLPELLS
jgi:hypothetical protein